MVVLGGLEFVAAGYLLHKYNKTKEEERRIEEEERRERRERRSRSEYRRKHSHEHRRHSRDRKQRYEDEHHSHGPRPRPQPQAQYLAQPAPQPPRASSAPPPMEGYYPPTGWPQEWKQSQRPERSAIPPATDYYNHPKYAESASRPDPKAAAATAAYYAQFQRRDDDGERKRRRLRGRSESRPLDTTRSLSRLSRNDTNSVPPSPHVRFATSDEEAHVSDRWDPPPEYRV